MPSYFADLMANAAPQMMRAFGTTECSYTSASGVVTGNLVIYAGGISTRTEDTDEGSRLTIRSREFGLLTDDQQNDFPGLAIVHLQGKFTIDGTEWNVEDLRVQNEYQIHGTLTNVRERRKTAPGTFRR